MPSKRLAKAGVSKEKFDSCIAHTRGKVSNPYAVCTAAFNKQKGFKSKKK